MDNLAREGGIAKVEIRISRLKCPSFPLGSLP